MNIKRITDNYGEITALCRETSFLWIGYLSSGIPKLRKVSASDPTLIYYDISLPSTLTATKINKIIVSGSYIYLAIDSITHVGIRYDTTNPLNTYTLYIKSGSVTENVIDVLTYSSYVYFLTPGISTTAKVLRYSQASTLMLGSVIIEKSGDTVNYARGFALDGSNNIWVITYTNPIKLIKITNALVISSITYLG